NLMNILLQIPVPTDSVTALKLQNVAEKANSHVDSLANAITGQNSSADSGIMGFLNNMDWSGIATTMSTQVISVFIKILIALLVFCVGKFLINKTYNFVKRLMNRRSVDKSLTSFLLSFIKITLLFILIIIVISILGIETSSFIAIFASAGVAIGMAMSGTLQNFAGGVIILLMKPYKVGDFIQFDGKSGTVKEIQIFNTIITTLSNEQIIIPNGGLSTGTINNYSKEKYRQVEWKVSLSYGDDIDVARKAILDILATDKRVLMKTSEQNVPEIGEEEIKEETLVDTNVSKSWFKRIFSRKKGKDFNKHNIQETNIKPLPSKIDFTPMVALSSLDDSAIVVIVRAWCKNTDFWVVYFNINEQIYTQFPKYGLNFPYPHLDIHLDNK
ncbi:MAG: mechanosensitive ion channel, partial [Bacteroidales bacterium]|nr:mechanosensitive ion channel [Candidatus Sodaliphilus aphodohippi]